MPLNPLWKSTKQAERIPPDAFIEHPDQFPELAEALQHEHEHDGARSPRASQSARTSRASIARVSRSTARPPPKPKPKAPAQKNSTQTKPTRGKGGQTGANSSGTRAPQAKSQQNFQRSQTTSPQRPATSPQAQHNQGASKPANQARNPQNTQRAPQNSQRAPQNSQRATQNPQRATQSPQRVPQNPQRATQNQQRAPQSGAPRRGGAAPQAHRQQNAPQRAPMNTQARSPQRPQNSQASPQRRGGTAPQGHTQQRANMAQTGQAPLTTTNRSRGNAQGPRRQGNRGRKPRPPARTTDKPPPESQKEAEIDQLFDMDDFDEKFLSKGQAEKEDAGVTAYKAEHTEATPENAVKDKKRHKGSSSDSDLDQQVEAPTPSPVAETQASPHAGPYFHVIKNGPLFPPNVNRDTFFLTHMGPKEYATFRAGNILKCIGGKVRIRNANQKGFTKQNSAWVEKGDIVYVSGGVKALNDSEYDNALFRVFASMR